MSWPKCWNSWVRFRYIDHQERVLNICQLCLSYPHSCISKVMPLKNFDKKYCISCFGSWLFFTICLNQSPTVKNEKRQTKVKETYRVNSANWYSTYCEVLVDIDEIYFSWNLTISARLTDKMSESPNTHKSKFYQSHWKWKIWWLTHCWR